MDPTQPHQLCQDQRARHDTMEPSNSARIAAQATHHLLQQFPRCAPYAKTTEARKAAAWMEVDMALGGKSWRSFGAKAKYEQLYMTWKDRGGDDCGLDETSQQLLQEIEDDKARGVQPEPTTQVQRCQAQAVWAAKILRGQRKPSRGRSQPAPRPAVPLSVSTPTSQASNQSVASRERINETRDPVVGTPVGLAAAEEAGLAEDSDEDDDDDDSGGFRIVPRAGAFYHSQQTVTVASGAAALSAEAQILQMRRDNVAGSICGEERLTEALCNLGETAKSVRGIQQDRHRFVEGIADLLLKK